LTRAVLATGVTLTLGTGIGLWLLPDRTPDYWAWTIKAPLSAALLGAGYTGAATSVGLGLRSGSWPRARGSAVTALSFTILALAVTLRHRDEFTFSTAADALPRLVGWVWLVVYVALPPLVVAAFAVQARAAVADGPRVRPLSRAATAAFVAIGALLGALGVPLLVEWDAALEAWPWPLAPLAGALVGAWLLTASAGLLWVALRERDWARATPSAAGGCVFWALLLLAAIRLRDGFEGTLGTVVYLTATAAMLVVVATLWWLERGTPRVHP
jgi:hypothetical protein